MCDEALRVTRAALLALLRVSGARRVRWRAAQCACGLGGPLGSRHSASAVAQTVKRRQRVSACVPLHRRLQKRMPHRGHVYLFRRRRERAREAAQPSRQTLFSAQRTAHTRHDQRGARTALGSRRRSRTCACLRCAAAAWLRERSLAHRAAAAPGAPLPAARSGAWGPCAPPRRRAWCAWRPACASPQPAPPLNDRRARLRTCFYASPGCERRTLYVVCEHVVVAVVAAAFRRRVVIFQRLQPRRRCSLPRLGVGVRHRRRRLAHARRRARVAATAGGISRRLRTHRSACDFGAGGARLTKAAFRGSRLFGRPAARGAEAASRCGCGALPAASVRRPWRVRRSRAGVV